MGYLTAAVVNRKGGTGKTITATNISAALGLLEYKVLAIDCDEQADMTKCLLPMENWEDYKSLVDAFVSKTLQGCIYKSTAKNVDIVPGHEYLFQTERDLGHVMNDMEYQLADLIRDSNVDEYNFIILDCSNKKNYLSTNALVAADTLIIPIDSYFATDAFVKLSEEIAAVQKRANPDLRPGHILITRHEPQSREGKGVLQVKDELNERVLDTIIPKNVALSGATNNNQAIFTYEPESAGAEAYMTAAKELVQKWGIQKE